MNAVAQLHERQYVHVLSSEEGPFLIKDAKVRELICLLSDSTRTYGKMLISQAHAMVADVTGYEYRVNRAGMKFEREYVTPKEISAKYAQATTGRDAAEDESTQQRQVLGFIAEARNLGANDIKITINGDHCTIRYLVHGRGFNFHSLRGSEGFRLARTIYNSMLENAGTSLNVLAQQDGNLKAEFALLAGLAGARVATRPGANNGLVLTMRLRYHNASNDGGIDDAGYTAEQIAAIYEMTEQQQGAVIFSGPTGSGKSTTMQLALEHVDRRERGELDIITIEDPIEDEFRGYQSHGRGGGIAQTPLVKNNDDPEGGQKAWPINIANLMRHAPKVIMPGEIRDRASADAALDFAMSGHVLWTTFHAFQADGILLRLDEWGVSRNMILNPQLIIGLINQRLVRRLCADCKEPLEKAWGRILVPPHVERRWREHIPVEKVFVTGDNPQCPACNGKGTKGRIVAAEVVVPDEGYMEAFRRGGALAARRYFVREMRGLTRIAHVRRHVADGLVDPRHAETDCGGLDRDHKDGLIQEQLHVA